MTSGTNKIFKQKTQKGMIGVGVLILFIAVLLVAAVAASVLLSSSSQLKDKGVLVGQEAEDGVSSGIEIMNMDGIYGNIGHDVEHFELDLRLAAGSAPINFNTTVILFDTESTTQNLIYNSTASTYPSDTTTYTIEYLHSGANHEDGYLRRGEVTRLRFNHHDATSATDTDGGIGEFKEARLKIIPSTGTAALIEFKTGVITVRRINLWPG